MHIYASELVKTWLSDATHGVNALLSSVPLLAGDTVPPNVTISTATRHKETTQSKAPLTTLPALQIMPPQRPMTRSSPSVRPYPSDVSVTLTLHYTASQDIDADQAFRDAEYTMLAIERSLTRLFSGAIPAGLALRNTYTTTYQAPFEHAEATEWETGYVSTQDAVVTGAMHITIRGRSRFAQT